MYKKYSVLMSVYDKENPLWLDESLRSVFNQTIDVPEVVLVKDGYINARLIEVIDKYSALYPKNLKLIQLEKNKGLGEALRVGMIACSYNIVARMDSDDICTPDRFEKQLDLMLRYPEIDILGSSIKEFSGIPKNVHSIRKVPEKHIDIVKYSKKRNPFCHMTVMLKKDAVLNAGNYITCLYFEDYYLWARMINNGAKCYNMQESLVWARTNDNMFMRRGGLNYFKDEVAFLNKLLEIRYITFPQLVKMLITRGFVRFLPNNVRKWIYVIYLRNKSQ